LHRITHGVHSARAPATHDERGALPLLAFALARLWEKRDRESGLLTRQAYVDIGGVGGALARHAEGLMERLGPERHEIVRELFRNLVTAEGTRAERDANELLAKLRSLTNLRAVPDPDTGWKVEIGPFPGWAEVPEWNP
jgi:hypothetical protein